MEVSMSKRKGRGLYISYTQEGMYITNKWGDLLYDVSDVPVEIVEKMIEDGSYTNWKQYHFDPPKTRGVGGEKVPLKGYYYREGDSLYESLMLHPKRTVKEAKLMASLDGLYFDEFGIARKKEVKE